MKAKRIIIANIALLALIFILSSTITLGPKGEIFERKPEFKWIGLPISYTIIIDDNPDFTTPITEKVKGNSYTPENDLALGDYYWKIKGIRNSNVQKFSLLSKVSLERLEEERLKNDGNVKLRLGLVPGAIGAAVLDINQSLKIGKEVEEVTAKQDE